MLEWQHEASLFTIRIQGKQWYWSYKFSSDIINKIDSLYINVGNNNFKPLSLNNNSGFYYRDSTMSFLFDYEFKKTHKKTLISQDNLNLDLLNLAYNSNTVKTTFFNIKFLSYKYFFYNIIKNNKNLLYLNFYNKLNIYSYGNNSSNNNYVLSNFNEEKTINKSYFKFADPYLQFIRLNSDNNFYFFTNLNKINFSYFDSDNLDNVEVASSNLRFKTFKSPIKLLKGTLNINNLNLLTLQKNLNKNLLFSIKINCSGVSEKITHPEQFWGFRQKKYKKIRAFSFLENYKYSNKNYNYINNFLNFKDFSKYNLYSNVKNNKYKSELIPVTLARRLLRTKRTLTLPVHINLTLITSSYDVVHSWFVPGLGLKIDCVPGRSTHHSLYIHNVGFYYGQCAEICGRYHHHMPIRVCALRFEHFMLWWKVKGLPRMYRSKKFIKTSSLLLNKFKY